MDGGGLFVVNMSALWGVHLDYFNKTVWVLRNGLWGGGGGDLGFLWVLRFFFFNVLQSSNAINWYFKNQPKHNFIFSVTNSKGLSFQPLKCHYCHGMAKLDLKKQTTGRFGTKLSSGKAWRRNALKSALVFVLFLYLLYMYPFPKSISSRNRSYPYMFFDNLFFVNK